MLDFHELIFHLVRTRTGICRLKFQSEMAGHLLGTIILFMWYLKYTMHTMYHIFLICFHLYFNIIFIIFILYKLIFPVAVLYKKKVHTSSINFFLGDSETLNILQIITIIGRNFTRNPPHRTTFFPSKTITRKINTLFPLVIPYITYLESKKHARVRA